MNLLTDTFKVPADFDGVLPCVREAALFASPALDADPYDEDFRTLTSAEQQSALAAKQVTERACVAACNTCPLVSQCRDWAMSVNVHGVAGGTTQAERRAANGWTGPELVPGEPSPREARGTETAHAARSNINLARVSDETLAMLRFLASDAGIIRPRDEVVAAGAPYVDDDTADRWGRHSAGDDNQKRESGRRKFLLNRLDIAIRRGRIKSTKTNAGVMLALASDVAEALQVDIVAA